MSQATTGCPYANDPRTRYDALHREPLTRDDNGRWVVVRHADAVAVVTDPETFSSHVSRFLQVPNGLDGTAHREARELLDPFLAPERLTGLEPTLERIADQLAASVPAGGRLDAVGELGSVYAVRAQSAWLGWPSDIEPELLAWMEDNHAATRSGELERTAAVAHRFDAIIHRLLSFRRIRRPGPPEDLTDELMRVKHHDGRPLGEDEIVSVLRNWTGGDLGSLALCTGVVLYWLATHPELQDELVDAANDSFDAALDEILRIDDPFVSNRRVATVDTVLNGQPIELTQKEFDLTVFLFRGAGRVLSRRDDLNRINVFPVPDDTRLGPKLLPIFYAPLLAALWGRTRSAWIVALAAPGLDVAWVCFVKIVEVTQHLAAQGGMEVPVITAAAACMAGLEVAGRGNEDYSVLAEHYVGKAEKD